MWTRKETKEWIEKTCGSGWLKLIDEVYDKLPHDLHINQAYQKWGILMFDLEGEDEEFTKFLEDIENKSSETCEICGIEGNEVTIKGWVHTRCENHLENSY